MTRPVRRASAARPHAGYKVSEHVEAVHFMTWARASERLIPALGLIYAVPNGGDRNVVVARKMKAEGVKAGVPDYCLPVARGDFHGLYIELKAGGGRPTPEQKAWIAALRAGGYRAEVCVGATAAQDLCLDYLGHGKKIA